jgi:hypothetical protein
VKILTRTMDRQRVRPMAQIAAVLCVLLFFGFVLADYAVATVKPPVHVKLSSDFVAEKGGPHIHVAKKGEIVNIKIEISSGIALDNADFELLLPEGWEFVGGDKGWRGKLQKDGTVILKAKARVAGDDFGVIGGRIHLPDVCSDIEGILDLRDPKTTDRVPEWGETTALPPGSPDIDVEDDVPGVEEESTLPEGIPESYEPSAHPSDANLYSSDLYDSCAVRAQGRLVYQDDKGAYIGLKYARVILWDSDDDWDDECGRGITDANGYYDISGNCGDPWNPFGNTEPPDIYIQVYAINTNYAQIGAPYTTVNPKINDFCGTYNYGTRMVPASQAGAYQLFNQAVQANQYIDVYDTIPPMVKVNWPAGGSGNWYNGEIYINNTWHEPSMYHEYGHFLMDTYATLPSFNYCNGICDASTSSCGHCLWAPENGYIPWMEGWPDFFADVQCRFWNRNDIYNFESHYDDTRYPNTAAIEGFNAAILWDIYDSTQDNQHGDGPSDQLSLGFDEIWNVTTNYDPGGTYHFPETIHEFWNGFYALYPGYRMGLWNVYAEHHITKPCPVTPVTPSLLSPVYGATGVSLTPVLDWGDISAATSYDVQVLNSTLTSVVRSAAVTGSQWTVSPALSANTLYYWKVRAKNACATSPWSSYRYFRTLCPLPAAPALVSPASGATGVSLNPLLDWGDVSGATSYEYQVSLSNTFGTIARTATVTGSQWTITTALNSGTTYYWRVRAKNACGAGPWSSYRSFTTACLSTVAPTLVSPASGATDVSLTPLLDWSDVANAASYEYQVSLSNTFGTIARTATVTGSQWTITTALNSGTTYYWRVRAKNACATAGPWSSIRSFKTRLCLLPGTPTLMSPANGATGVSLNPLLDWGDVSGATSYEYQVSLSNTFGTIARTATVTGSQWTITTALSANTTYYWRVRAKNACATAGSWSSYRYFKTGL